MNSVKLFLPPLISVMGFPAPPLNSFIHKWSWIMGNIFPRIGYALICKPESFMQYLFLQDHTRITSQLLKIVFFFCRRLPIVIKRGKLPGPLTLLIFLGLGLHIFHILVFSKEFFIFFDAFQFHHLFHTKGAKRVTILTIFVRMIEAVHFAFWMNCVY